MIPTQRARVSALLQQAGIDARGSHRRSSREVSQRPIGPEGRILRGGHDVSQHVPFHQPILGVVLNHHVSKPVHVDLVGLFRPSWPLVGQCFREDPAEVDVVMIVDRSLRMKVDFNPSEEVLDHRFVVGSVRFEQAFCLTFVNAHFGQEFGDLGSDRIEPRGRIIGVKHGFRPLSIALYSAPGDRSPTSWYQT